MLVGKGRVWEEVGLSRLFPGFERDGFFFLLNESD